MCFGWGSPPQGPSRASPLPQVSICPWLLTLVASIFLHAHVVWLRRVSKAACADLVLAMLPFFPGAVFLKEVLFAVPAGLLCRMLADTQQLKQRENSLVMAVSCFASTALAFEHAEALLCLAQHMVRAPTLAPPPINGCWAMPLRGQC